MHIYLCYLPYDPIQVLVLICRDATIYLVFCNFEWYNYVFSGTTKLCIIVVF